MKSNTPYCIKLYLRVYAANTMFAFVYLSVCASVQSWRVTDKLQMDTRLAGDVIDDMVGHA